MTPDTESLSEEWAGYAAEWLLAEEELEKTMADYTLERTGLAPLAFSGELLASVRGEDLFGKKRSNPRWHDIDLYRTKGGRYVLGVRYRTEWGDEVGFDEAAVLETPEDVRECLAGWDAVAPVAGWPPLPSYRERQERLLADVRARFERGVSDLFGKLGSEFAERVD